MKILSVARRMDKITKPAITAKPAIVQGNPINIDKNQANYNLNDLANLERNQLSFSKHVSKFQSFFFYMIHNFLNDRRISWHC